VTLTAAEIMCQYGEQSPGGRDALALMIELGAVVGQYILSRMLSRTRINYHNYRSEKIIIISDTMTKRQQTDTLTIK
jgi:hypothetical protein